MLEHEIIEAYYRGSPVDKLARDTSRTWAEVAQLVGHVWRRPAHLDERGFPVAEEDWQGPGTVVGVD